jgi:hypothetical protein
MRLPDVPRLGGVEAVPVMRSTRARIRGLAMRDVPVWDEAHARQIAGLPPKPSRIVPLTLAAAFLVLALIAHAQNGVIHKQAATLALYESAAPKMAKAYESASLRASMALAAYDRCVGLRGVSAP